jgi:hypothetical protein
MALSMPGPGPSDMMGLEFLIVRLWATTLFPGFHHCKNILKLYQTLLINLDHLVGGFNPSEKYESVGMRTFSIYGKKMFQTTSQNNLDHISKFTKLEKHHFGLIPTHTGMPRIDTRVYPPVFLSTLKLGVHGRL